MLQKGTDSCNNGKLYMRLFNLNTNSYKCNSVIIKSQDELDL